jgi:hypothetical protein
MGGLEMATVIGVDDGPSALAAGVDVGGAGSEFEKVRGPTVLEAGPPV